MKSQKLNEGKIEVTVPKGYKLDSKMPVFYNPVQVLNRDLSILLLNAIERKTTKPLRVLDIMAASGIRGLRIKKEVPNVDVTLNDYNKKAAKSIQENAKLNKLKVKIENKPANVLLSELNSYDYIDLDPFGTPVPFLDAAIRRLSPHGVIGVTATDTSALCGAAPRACLRKYGSKPLRNEFMHETAVRILIKKVQEVAAQYDVALVPIFSHSSNHYVRVYLQKIGAAKKADDILKQHGYILYCQKCCYRRTSTDLLLEITACPECKTKMQAIGPVWLGDLWDKKTLDGMLKAASKASLSMTKYNAGDHFIANRYPNFDIKTLQLLVRIYREAKVKTVGFYDLHWLAKKKKWGSVPRMDDVLRATKGPISDKSRDLKAARTHFRLTGIRTKKLNM